MFAAAATFGAVEAGETSTAPLFGALIVDVVATAVVTVTSAFLQSLPHHHPSQSLPQATPIDAGSIDYDFETPCATPDTIMGGVSMKRAVTPIETPKPKRVYEEVDEDGHGARVVKHTGPSYTASWCRDFSAIQRTRVNPVTGRIIGYKGIPRKRALSPTSKYSSFWRQQKYGKPSLHAARSPGIWDSARR